MIQSKPRGFNRNKIKTLGERSNGNNDCSNGDEMLFVNKKGEFPDTLDLNNRSVVPEEDETPPEDDRVNLVGDTDRVSDASMAIRALLGEGGDFRAGSEIDDNEVRAILVLLDVAEELNSPRLLKTAENFLLLSISKSGTGRKQVVGAFKGLYEPNNQPGQDGSMPSGYLRGVK